MVLVAQPGGRPRDTRARFGVAHRPRRSTRFPTWTTPGRRPRFRSGSRAGRLPPSAARPGGSRTSAAPMISRVARTADASHPALGDPRGWAIRFGRELNATDDRHHFGPSGMPVIEGKHLAPFAVRHHEPGDAAVGGARQSVAAGRRLQAVRGSATETSRASATGCRSSPRSCRPASSPLTRSSACATRLPDLQQHFLCGLFNSYVLNAVVRLLMGGHVTTSLVEHLPAPPWRDTGRERRIAALAEELSHPATTPRRFSRRARLKRRSRPPWRALRDSTPPHFRVCSRAFRSSKSKRARWR